MSDHHETDGADLIRARRALQFAKLHDWGATAALGQMRDGTYRISGILDAWTQRQPDGTVSCGHAYVTLPATVGALRDFGGY